MSDEPTAENRMWVSTVVTGRDPIGGHLRCGDPISKPLTDTSKGTARHRERLRFTVINL